ncbi:MAG: rRNA maturation RNase YbeY [Sphingobacteriia bacterium]|nr:rRNA maturation RNase YbeY [Paludibacteraceae bacterium]NCA79155.1 rRNA maturation RNase YbeY [Sphingobacteriia bacterium]
MMIAYYSENVRVPKFKRRHMNTWIKAVAQVYGKTIGDVSYIFCDDAKILEVNKTYLKHNYFTDIITFDNTEHNRLSGDVFISVDTVRDNAKRFGVSFSEELHRVMIHGILHLCGQNDKTQEESKQMREKENMALKLVINFEVC